MKDSYMIGKNVLTLDYNDFIKGMSTSDNFPDGGFSPTTSQVNLINSHGAVYQPAVMVDASTNLATADDIIATCEEPTGTNNRMILAQRDIELAEITVLIAECNKLDIVEEVGDIEKNEKDIREGLEDK